MIENSFQKDQDLNAINESIELMNKVRLFDLNKILIKALHIAIFTLNNIDYLISWNFKQYCKNEK